MSTACPHLSFNLLSTCSFHPSCLPAINLQKSLIASMESYLLKVKLNFKLIETKIPLKICLNSGWYSRKLLQKVFISEANLRQLNLKQYFICLGFLSSDSPVGREIEAIELTLGGMVSLAFVEGGS